MKKKNKELIYLLTKIFLVMVELAIVIGFTCMAIYVLKSLIGINMFPNWSPFH